IGFFCIRLVYGLGCGLGRLLYGFFHRLLNGLGLLFDGLLDRRGFLLWLLFLYGYRTFNLRNNRLLFGNAFNRRNGLTFFRRLFGHLFRGGFRLARSNPGLHIAKASVVQAKVDLDTVLGKWWVGRPPRDDHEQQDQHDHSDPCGRDRGDALVLFLLFRFNHCPGRVATTTFASRQVAIPAPYSRWSDGASRAVCRTTHPPPRRTRRLSAPSSAPRVTRRSFTS